jgi:hypothetical protein
MKALTRGRARAKQNDQNGWHSSSRLRLAGIPVPNISNLVRRHERSPRTQKTYIVTAVNRRTAIAQ